MCKYIFDILCVFLLSIIINIMYHNIPAHIRIPIWASVEVKLQFPSGLANIGIPIWATLLYRFQSGLAEIGIPILAGQDWNPKVPICGFQSRLACIGNPIWAGQISDWAGQDWNSHTGQPELEFQSQLAQSGIGPGFNLDHDIYILWLFKNLC